MSSLELQSEIRAHSAWKHKFEFAIAGIQTEPLDAESAGDFTQCRLGQWLLANGSRFAEHPMFQQLSATHTKFHHVASQIVSMVNDGKTAEANTLLNADFNALSETIVFQLQQMREIVNR
ncbi:MAG: CZB domain-containing protein [Burkholderiales bacterium]|nr:CZB domain-containing protein [Burkholderiales bacterium]